MTETYTASVIPAKAGIQTIINAPTQWDNTQNTALSAAWSYMKNWIPASAGMTGFGVSHAVFNYVKLNKRLKNAKKPEKTGFLFNAVSS